MTILNLLLGALLLNISLVLAASGPFDAILSTAFSRIGSNNPECAEMLDSIHDMMKDYLIPFKVSDYEEAVEAIDEFLSNAFVLYDELPEYLEEECSCTISALIFQNLLPSDSLMIGKLEELYQVGASNLECEEFRAVFFPIYRRVARIALDHPDCVEEMIVKQLTRFYQLRFTGNSLKEQLQFTKLAKFISQNLFNLEREQILAWTREDRDHLTGITGEKRSSPMNSPTSPKRARHQEESPSTEFESNDGDDEALCSEDDDEDEDQMDIFTDPRPYLMILNLNETEMRPVALNNLKNIYAKEIQNDFKDTDQAVRDAIQGIYLSYIDRVFA